MYLVLTILIFLVALFLIFIVLIQNSKGGGLASGFSSSNQVMGVRKTTDFLEKATWTMAAIVLLGSILATGFMPRAISGEKQSAIKEQVEEAVTMDPNLIAPDFDNAE